TTAVSVDTDTAALYNPVLNTWTATGSFPDAGRSNHTGTTLSGNRVLITGGAIAGIWTTSTLLWSEVGGAWLPSGDLLDNTNTLYGQTALDGATVLVSGGLDGNFAVPSKSGAQIFSPLAN